MKPNRTKPDVKQRADLYAGHHDRFVAQVRRCTEVHGKLAMIDLRDEPVIYAGNRCMIYALFPQCDISAHVLWGARRQNTVFAIGKSILDRGSTVDVGEVCLGHGGGGQRAAGTCQIAKERAEAVRAELIGVLSGAPVEAAA